MAGGPHGAGTGGAVSCPHSDMRSSGAALAAEMNERRFIWKEHRIAPLVRCQVFPEREFEGREGNGRTETPSPYFIRTPLVPNDVSEWLDDCGRDLKARGLLSHVSVCARLASINVELPDRSRGGAYRRADFRRVCEEHIAQPAWGATASSARRVAARVGAKERFRREHFPPPWISTSAGRIAL